MCGISGIISKYNKKNELEKIKEMNDLISHRGPDDEGFFNTSSVSFGHRRLSILDLSNHGHQPMHYMDKYVITYNGEIYNYIEIKKELLEEGYQFISDTDTEVILASYDKWGEECVNKFNGMWAFAIYDKNKNIIFCSRDRFGIKPFYYANIDDNFIFGSEIKQILPFLKNRYVNNDILLDYLKYNLLEHTNETFFENIYKLEPLHNLVYDLNTHQYTKYKYFDIIYDESIAKLSSETENINILEESLNNSILLRLRSDVQVASCLSGGLDSSTIVAIASRRYKFTKSFAAIHAKSSDINNDESKYAKEVSNYLNVDLNIIEPSNSDFLTNIDEVIYTQEEPFGGPSIFMQYFVMRQAKYKNYKVMLDGQGGDETLFGYEKYFTFYFSNLLREGKIFQYIKNLLELHTFKSQKKEILKNSFIYLFKDKTLIFEDYIKHKNNNIKIKHNIDRIKYLFEFKSFKDFQKREIIYKNIPKLLRYEDKNSMRHSIETRLPFLDFTFVTTALSIDDNLKFKDNYLKYLLRKIGEKYLPKNIIWRKNKFGFEAPTKIWLEEYKNEMVLSIKASKLLDNILEVDNVNLENKTMLWKLYNIAKWAELYKVEFKK